MDEFKQTIEDIKSIKIQGATNVALEGIEALAKFAEQLSETNPQSFLQQLESARSALWTARSTEPALQNGLRYVLKDLPTILEREGVAAAKITIRKLANKYKLKLQQAKEQIGKIGAARIVDGAHVMTHCHSSFVIEIIKTAVQQGKEVKAFCTETRPRYQGRKTAQELLNLGIDTTMIVDSGMRWIIRRGSVDIILTGADSITSQGTVINKIGTRLLALAAKESDIPFYSAASLLKFDVETKLGYLTEIEMRSRDEVWPDAPSSLKILNPAFETVSRDLIDGLITEVGIFPPSSVYAIVVNEFPFLLHSFERPSY